jgi:transcription factor E2F7/8
MQTHTIDTRKPAFRWLGFRGRADIGSASNDSRKRMFGSDLTNVSFKRNKVDEYLNGDLKVKKQMKCDNLADEVDRKNLEQDSKQSSKSYQFGPFAPSSVPKIVVPQDNSVARVQDWEQLASTHRPQYQNQGMISYAILQFSETHLSESL